MPVRLHRYVALRAARCISHFIAGDLWVSTVPKGLNYCIVDNTAPVYVYSMALNSTWFFQDFQWSVQLPPDWLQFPFACNCSPNAPKPRKSLLGPVEVCHLNCLALIALVGYLCKHVRVMFDQRAARYLKTIAAYHTGMR